MAEEQINSENNGANGQPGSNGLPPADAAVRESTPEAAAEKAADATARGEVTTATPSANMKWYIIHTYSGFERKVKESIEARVRADERLAPKIGRVLIPTESVTEVRGGKKYTSERMYYPGYVLV